MSPLGGTVVFVGMAVGSSVSAGDSASGITVVDTGSYQVTGSLTSTQANAVAAGVTWATVT